MDFAGIKVPDTALVHDAIDLSRSLLEPFLFNHVMRSWLFGIVLAESAAIAPDAELLYRPGISFRFVRSPEAPKIIRTHESPVGIGSCDNFSRGLAWILADIIVSSSRFTNISFEWDGAS